jgi:NADH-quinone oxidoreductase subunit J
LQLIDSVSILQVFGQTLYTKYVFYFLVAGFVLLAAMVSAIVLVINARAQNKRQHVFEQLARTSSLSVFNVKDIR